MEAVILAAGVGRRLKDVWGGPKCLLPINGETLLSRMVRILHSYGVGPVTVVVGHRSEDVGREVECLRREGLAIRTIENPQHEKGSVLSIMAAADCLSHPVLIMDADLYFDPKLVERLVRSPKKDVFAIDRTSGGDDEAVLVGFRNGRACELARGLSGEYEVKGEWAGCLRLSLCGAQAYLRVLEHCIAEGRIETGYEFVVPEIFGEIPIGFELVDGISWAEIDFAHDVERVRSMKILPLEPKGRHVS